VDGTPHDPPVPPPPGSAPPPPRSGPPPGWYREPGSQSLRWWDGAQWGPVAPSSPQGSNTALSVFCHLGLFLMGIVLPLIIYTTAGKDDPDVRHHAREALNFQLTFLLVWMAGFLGMFLVVGATLFAGTTAPPVGLFVGFPMLFGLFFAAVGFAIYGAVQAGRGQRWRYPVSIRLVGRHDDDASVPPGS
jgi:uncharacterized protein